MCVCVCLSTHRPARTLTHTHIHTFQSCLPLRWAQIGEHDYSQGAKCIRETSPAAGSGNASFPRFQTNIDLCCVALCFLCDFWFWFYFGVRSWNCQLSHQSVAGGKCCASELKVCCRCAWKLGGLGGGRGGWIVLFLSDCTSSFGLQSFAPYLSPYVHVWGRVLGQRPLLAAGGLWSLCRWMEECKTGVWLLTLCSTSRDFWGVMFSWRDAPGYSMQSVLEGHKKVQLPWTWWKTAVLTPYLNWSPLVLFLAYIQCSLCFDRDSKVKDLISSALPVCLGLSFFESTPI